MLDRLGKITQRFSIDLKKIAANASWLLLDRLIVMITGLVVGAWVARYLGPEKFGLYNYATSIVSFLTPITGISLISIIVRDLARTPSEKDNILGTTFLIFLVGGAITVPLAVILSLLLEPSNQTIQILVGVIAFSNILLAFDTIDIWFQSQTQSKQIVVARRSSGLIAAIFKLTLIQLHAPLIAFAWTISVELVLSAISMMITFELKGNSIKKWRFIPGRAKEMIREGLPLILAGISVYICSRIDQVMLGSLLTDKSQLGFYSIAVKISEVFNFLPMVVASSIFPKLSTLDVEDVEYQNKLQVYFDIMLFLWLIVALPISLFSSPIILFLYGSDYSPAARILGVYVWAQFGANLGVARSSFLTIKGILKYSLYLGIIGAFLNIGLNYFLIPQYQAMGATVATLITYLVVIVLANFFIRDLRIVGIMILRSLNLYRAALRIKGLLA